MKKEDTKQTGKIWLKQHDSEIVASGDANI